MKYLFILFVLLPLCVFSQEKRESLWSVDAFYAPSLFIPSPILANSDFKQEAAYRVGFNIVKISEKNAHLALRIGLRYAVYNQRIESFSVSQGQFVNAISFAKYNFYELPLAFRYSIGKNRLRGYGELLGCINFGANTTRLKTHFNIGFSFGLEYNFYQQYSIFAQPTFYKTTAQNNIYFLTSGAEIGLKFRFQDY
jgi:hypothetical protein